MSQLQPMHSLLQTARQLGASDLHLKADSQPFFRVSGRLISAEAASLSLADLNSFLQASIPEALQAAWQQDGQIDYSYYLPELGRFRVNAFYQRGQLSAVMRVVHAQPPSFASLNLDGAVLTELCAQKAGIILLCGATGSGKSSTLAAMLQHMNQTYDYHIVTLEDPIEYSHPDQRCIINQREIGLDCPSFSAGMRAALRQDPDVLLIGEMRDAFTFETALRAAETGHLVLATLHAANATQAVQRLFEFFPDQTAMMQRQVASTLLATITQRLVPASEGEGRYPATEYFVVEALGRKTLLEGKFDQIEQIIELNSEGSSQSFNQDLLRLVEAKQITADQALSHSPNPQELKLQLQGIFLTQRGIIH
jgi:twitching motility protein PilT